MKKISLNTSNVLIAIVAIILCIFYIASCNNSSEINIVKDAVIYAGAPTVGEAANKTFYNPKWSFGIGPNGENIVELKGKILVGNKKKKAVLQFVVNKASEEFTIQSLELDGVPQQYSVISELFDLMYQ